MVAPRAGGSSNQKRRMYSRQEGASAGRVQLVGPAEHYGGRTAVSAPVDAVRGIGVVQLVVAAASFNPAEAALRAGLLRERCGPPMADYTAGPVGAALDGPVDTLLNLVPLSPPDAAALARVLRQGGRLVSIATPIEPSADAGVSAVHMVARNDVAQLAALVELVDATVLGIDIGDLRPLAGFADVHRRSEEGQTRGKVIITP